MPTTAKKPPVKSKPTPPAPQPTGEMELKLLEENIKKALEKVEKAVGKSDTMPILACVLLHADAEKQLLTITATNLEAGIIVRVGANVTQGGALAVPFKLLNELVKSLKDDGVLNVSQKGDTLKLLAAGGQVKLNITGMDANDFPMVTVGKKRAQHFPIAPELFAALVRRTIFSAATDDSRPVLTGVMFVADGNTITLSAADGFRLAEAHATTDSSAHFKVLVSAKVLKDIVLRALSDTEPVTLSCELNGATVSKFVVETGPVTVVITPLEGNFPDFKALFPTPTTHCQLHRAALVTALKTAGVYAKEGVKTANLNMKAQTDKPHELVITSRAVSGHGELVLDCTIEGAPLALAVNYAYLLDAVEAADSDLVDIGFISPSSPILVMPVGISDYRGVMTPMMSN